MKCRLVLIAAGSVTLRCAISCSSEKNGGAAHTNDAAGIKAVAIGPTKADARVIKRGLLSAYRRTVHVL